MTAFASPLPSPRMRALTCWVLVALTLGLLCAAAGPAAAKKGPVRTTVTGSAGSVRATFVYTRASKHSVVTSLKRLDISRRGTPVLHDTLRRFRGFSPGGYRDQPTLKVADLDGDGEPEVLLTLFTGGAHCCVDAEIYRYRAATSSYVRSETNFASAGFRLRDLDGNGLLEFQTVDPAFEDAFTSHAESVGPLQVLRLQSGRLADVTKAFPAQVRRDLVTLQRLYPRFRKRHADLRGLLAATAAEEIVLGDTEARDATFVRARKVGGAAFLGRLKRFLAKEGYRS